MLKFITLIHHFQDNQDKFHMPLRETVSHDSISHIKLPLNSKRDNIDEKTVLGNQSTRYIVLNRRQH